MGSDGGHTPAEILDHAVTTLAVIDPDPGNLHGLDLSKLDASSAEALRKPVRIILSIAQRIETQLLTAIAGFNPFEEIGHDDRPAPGPDRDVREAVLQHPVFQYLREFRESVLQGIAHNAKEILRKAGKLDAILPHLDQPAKWGRILGAKWDHPADVEAALGLPPKRPAPTRKRVHTLPWAAALVLVRCREALALHTISDLDQMRALDRELLLVGNSLLDAAQARAARSHKSRQAATALRDRGVREGDTALYVKVLAAVAEEKAVWSRAGKSLRGVQAAVAKKHGWKKWTVSRACKLGKLPAEFKT